MKKFLRYGCTLLTSKLLRMTLLSSKDSNGTVIVVAAATVAAGMAEVLALLTTDGAVTAFPFVFPLSLLDSSRYADC